MRLTPLAVLVVAALGSHADQAVAPHDLRSATAVRAVSATADVRHYTMSGKVRPLLFWIGRDDIGLGRIVRRREPDGARGYEFLVGTDPSRAPRSINRWGFISEQVQGEDGSLFALMTAADAGSYDEAERAVGGDGHGADFRAIRARVDRGESISQVARVGTSSALTVHDVDAAVDRLRAAAAAARSSATPVPAGARPGFLTAVAELIDASLEPATGAKRRPSPAAVRYVFGQSAYEVRLRSTSRADAETLPREAAPVRGDFEIRTLATGNRTRFEVTWGTTGELAGVPLFIAWQPRWWLKVELRLQREDTAVARR